MSDYTERRLAAVVVADVVGYSAHMQRDEEGTRNLFNKLSKNFVLPLSRLYGGRIIKSMGDAYLLEFSSVVNAVTCAVELQRQLGQHVGDSDTLDLQTFQFRIAVNLGDIIAEGEDIHGEGVNVAARLQEHAPPGGVVLSEAAFTQIKGKSVEEFEDGGSVRLKNIDGDWQLYVWSPQQEKPDIRIRQRPASGRIELRDHASVLIKPVVCLERSVEMLSAGLTDALITELSRFSELSVRPIGRTQSPRQTSEDVDTVPPHARYCLDCRVGKIGEETQTSVLLLETENGSAIWAERFYHSTGDPSAAIEDIVKTVCAVLPNRLRVDLIAHIADLSDKNRSPHALVLQGNQIFQASGGADPRSVTLLQEALEVDPQFALAHAVLANVYAYSVFSLGIWYDDPEERSVRSIEPALRYGTNDPVIHALVGKAYFSIGELTRSRMHIDLSLHLNPHDVHARMTNGALLNYSGEHQAGLDVFDTVLGQEPHLQHHSKEQKAECLFMLGRYSDCLDMLETWDTPPPHTYAQIAACYAHMGNSEKASEAARIFKKLSWESSDFGRYAANHARICLQQADKENWLNGYKLAGLLSE